MIARVDIGIVCNAKAYPGADIVSDHNPVVAKMRVKLITDDELACSIFSLPFDDILDSVK